MGKNRAAVGKFVFADQLRGIAALLVVMNHYTGIYWYARGTVAHYIFSPMQSGPVPLAVQDVVNVPFNPGPLGVALFFMISGFVIPFSFRHHTTFSFLCARALRIYPTYLLALAVGLAARYLSARYWGQHFAVYPVVVLGNGLLVHDLVGMSTIDLVNWTLTIELKFYLLFALAYQAIMRWQGRFVVACAVAAIAFNLAAVAALPHVPSRVGYALRDLSNEAMWVPFMLLGTLFFLNVQGLLSKAGLIWGSVLGLGLFLLCWRVGPVAGQFPTVAENYVFGWIVFALCFLGRRWFVPIAPLRWLASISYPLYLVHPMVGYAIIAMLVMGKGLGYCWAAGVALGCVLLLATAIHLLIERRSIAWGRALGRPDFSPLPNGLLI
jgi:peptidoglycan/LPS O-acetylase OafA/YrhL